MTAYYNEIDPYAAQWLRNLIAAGHIAPGVVDERSIEDVLPDDLRGFTQCHFFAGIGVWSLALRRAGWPDDRPVWTGSCPCQPFSAAGAGAGFADERHLWPAFFHLITQCAPPVVLGEQVASKAVEPWVDLVHADMEAMGYAFGAVPFPSAGVGAPHIRDRLFWVADALRPRSLPGAFARVHRGQESSGSRHGELERPSADGGMAEPNSLRFQSSPVSGIHNAERHLEPCGGIERLGHANSKRVRRIAGAIPGEEVATGREVRSEPDPSESSGATCRPGPVNGFWRSADWLGCRDDKWRPVEPGTSPLANGASSRVGRLRAYGNAINAEAATQFIFAYLEQPDMIYLTDYNPDTLACTSASADSGFSTFDEVRQLMGEPQMSHAHMLTYPGGVCFSDFALKLETDPCTTN